MVFGYIAANDIAQQAQAQSQRVRPRNEALAQSG
jgi:hypothetical protein